MVIINDRKLKSAVLVYTVLPVAVFFLGWLKLWLSIPGVFLLALASVFVLRGEKEKPSGELEQIHIPRGTLVFVIVFALVWCFFSGIGGMFFQNTDFNERNAMLRDIINYDWPVVYAESNRALVYYIAQFLVPALFGKTALAFTGSTDIAWAVGNFALYLWCAAGVALVLLLLLLRLKAEGLKKCAVVCLVFVLFSGLDIVGWALASSDTSKQLEWWAGAYQYSSITTCLFWVFNQAIVPWMLTLCILSEKNIRNYAFWGLICLPFGPFPFLGILVYCVVLGVLRGVREVKNRRFKSFLRDAFSPQNLIACAVIFPVFLLYYRSNTLAGAEGALTGGGLRLYWQDWGPDEIFRPLHEAVRYILFIGLECGIYLLLLLRANRNKAVYWITAASLLTICLFRYGTNSVDFAMRVSIPAILVLAVMVIRYLLEHWQTLRTKGCKKVKLAYCLLAISVLIGAVTPGAEFARGFNAVWENKKLAVVSDNVGSIGSISRTTFFVCEDFENTIFFKFLAKEG